MVKRNVKIEIIRIIACMMVIWYHIREFPFKDNGELNETAVFFECICTICVVTFFLITGFFIYNKDGNIITNWIGLIKKFFTKTFIPFIITVIFCIIFHEFLITRATFTECIASFSLIEALNTIKESFLTFSADPLPGTAAHLWYIYSYAIIIFCYPITKYILTKLPKIVSYIIIIILTVFMVINDYHLFYGDPSYNKIFEIIHKPIYYSAVGYVLYNDIIRKYIDGKNSKSLIINVKIFIISFVIYIISFIGLFKTQCAYDLTINGPYVYTSWLSIFSLLLSSSFILFTYSINFEMIIDSINSFVKRLNEKVKENFDLRNVVFFISSKTLGIYMIHYLLITKLLSLGVQVELTRYMPHFLNHLLYYMLDGGFIFIVSVLIVCIIERISRSISLLVKKH